MKRSGGNGEDSGRCGKGAGVSGGIRDGGFRQLGRECEWNGEGDGWVCVDDDGRVCLFG